MDLDRDELRRQLRDADREQRASLVTWKDALHRIFADHDLPTAAKAELLGVPGRRQFLRIGGATILGAAVLAACGSDSENKAAETGTTSTTGTGSTSTTVATGGAGDEQMDVTLVRTAASLENLAVTVYGVALGTSDAAKLPAEVRLDQAVVALAERFQEHHQAHADALNAVLDDAGEDRYTKANEYVFDNVVAKRLPSLTDQTALVHFARDIENVAAGTYAFAASALSTADLRRQMMSIGGVEARHATALALVLDASGSDAVPRPFTDAGPENRVPEDAFLTKG